MSAQIVEEVIADLSKDEVEEDAIQVPATCLVLASGGDIVSHQLLNAMEMPRLEYEPSTRQFHL